jgi:hypothetical protein
LFAIAATFFLFHASAPRRETLAERLFGFAVGYLRRQADTDVG